MSYEVYKLIHFFAIISLFLSLGCLLAYSSGTKKKKVIMALHGLATFFIFLSGFGLIARLGISMSVFPTWLLIKIAIWTILSIAVPVLIAKKINKKAIVLLIFASALIAIFMAVFKL